MNMQELLNQKITIPAIQRDFAMGRNDDRSRDIRQKFIRELLHAIYGAAPLHLDFVYGLNQGDALLPLDGQQRLTMLYLLAWFCGADICGWEFDYESRRSTEFFMDGMKKHPRSEKNGPPSVEIRRSTWFSPAWELDPSVAGMLQVLDDMEEISSGCKYEHAPDFTNISLERFDIGSLCAGEEYGNIFLKMNARGLPLTSWENLKAVLDLHAPAGEWKEKIGPWQEKVWSMMPSADFSSNIASNIERLDIAMEKIVRIFASSFLYGPDTKEMQYGISAFRLGNVVNEHEIFFRQCARCFEKLGDISANWSENRCDNRLWGCDDDSCDFTAWLMVGGVPSLASQLRLIFLTEECGDERRVRILLNLLDNSSISAEKYHAARDSGLKFLHDGELPTAESGFNTHQLDDEKFKAGLPDDDIVKLEKHPLVWLGSLSFLHPQGGLPSLREMDSRLTLLSDTIRDRWQELYFTLLSSMPYADNDRDRVPERICIPRRDTHLWATEIFDNRKHERLHHALAAFYDGSRFDEGCAPTWLIHLEELIKEDCLPAALGYIKFARGWNYCIKDVNLSGNAARLARSACELGNLKKMKKDFFRDGEIPYHGFFRIEGTDCYYQIADKGDASWYESDQPRRYRKEQTESGEEKFVVD